MELSAIGKGGEKGISTLKTDSYAVLLVQGLESKDKNILNVSLRSFVCLFLYVYV